MRTHLRRDVAQKSGPARRQNCSTVYFPIVIEKYQNIISFFHPRYKKLLIDPGLAWDDFFGRRRVVDLLSVRDFFIQSLAVSSYVPGMKYIQAF